MSEGPFDLLVTDIGLPGIDGRELAKTAREKMPSLPVLLITGYAGKSADGMNLSEGIEVLRKPFSLDDLISRVRALLALKATAKQP